jgi:ankyrin repeat protein
MVKCINNADRSHYASAFQQIMFRVNHKKFDVNKPDKSGYTMFMNAVKNRNTYICDMLLFSGANPLLETSNHYNVYEIAIKYDSTGKMVEYLDKQNIALTNPERTIKYAIRKNILSPLYYLFTSGRLDKNIKIHFGSSQKYYSNVIYYAIRKNLQNLVTVLINLSADIYSSYKGYTPLEFAVHRNQYEISKLLYRNGGRFRPIFVTRIVQKYKQCHSMMTFVDSIC